MPYRLYYYQRQEHYHRHQRIAWEFQRLIDHRILQQNQFRWFNMKHIDMKSNTFCSRCKNNNMIINIFTIFNNLKCTIIGWFISDIESTICDEKKKQIKCSCSRFFVFSKNKWRDNRQKWFSFQSENVYQNVNSYYEIFFIIWLSSKGNS